MLFLLPVLRRIVDGSVYSGSAGIYAGVGIGSVIWLTGVWTGISVVCIGGSTTFEVICDGAWTAVGCGISVASGWYTTWGTGSVWVCVWYTGWASVTVWEAVIWSFIGTSGWTSGITYFSSGCIMTSSGVLLNFSTGSSTTCGSGTFSTSIVWLTMVLSACNSWGSGSFCFSIMGSVTLETSTTGVDWDCSISCSTISICFSSTFVVCSSVSFMFSLSGSLTPAVFKSPISSTWCPDSSAFCFALLNWFI